MSSITPFSSPFTASCSAGDSCFPFFTVQAVNRVDPTRVLVCTQQSNPTDSICYSATFNGGQSATRLEWQPSALSSPITDVAAAYVYGGVRGGVANVDVAFVVGGTFIWSRDTVKATAAEISLYSSGVCSIAAGCLLGNSVNTAPPWKAMIGTSLSQSTRRQNNKRHEFTSEGARN